MMTERKTSGLQTKNPKPVRHCTCIFKCILVMRGNPATNKFKEKEI